MISGALLLAAGVGLIAAQSWARWTAVVLVGLHALSQVAWLSAYPVWALLMVGLDTVLIFALTARWSVVQEAVGAEEAPARAAVA